MTAVKAKAQPQDWILSPPTPVGLAKSSMTPNMSGPLKAPMNPMHECTAMVVPR